MPRQVKPRSTELQKVLKKARALALLEDRQDVAQQLQELYSKTTSVDTRSIQEDTKASSGGVRGKDDHTSHRMFNLPEVFVYKLIRSLFQVGYMGNWSKPEIAAVFDSLMKVTGVAPETQGILEYWVSNCMDKTRQESSDG